MSIRLCITIFALLSIMNCQVAGRKYVIQKDAFRFYKAAEFTVYDVNEKHMYYRIESTFSLLQNVKVIAYPSMQEVGRLNAKLKLFLYKAEFSIVDPQSDERVSGLIRQKFKLTLDLFTIEWGGKNITMEKKSFSFTTEFRDSIGGKILAQFRLRPASIFWTRKYDMEIFSDKYPEQVYLLALAAFDRLYSKN